MTDHRPLVGVVKRPPPPISRRLPKDFAKQIRRYATRTGLVNWAWNQMHSGFFLIFWFSLKPSHKQGKHETAHGIWHTIQSDFHERQMLLRVARTELENRPKLLARVEWVIGRADKLAAWRNIAAHVPSVFNVYMTKAPMAEGASTRDQMRKRFNEIDHEKFWNLLAGDLIVLSRYATRLAFEIYRPGLDGPLPHRPQLPSVPMTEEIDSRINRKTLEGKKRQQSASREKPESYSAYRARKARERHKQPPA